MINSATGRGHLSIPFVYSKSSGVIERTSLPSASALLEGSTPGLVFSNPYKLAENAKIASLEKHVKMVR